MQELAGMPIAKSFGERFWQNNSACYVFALNFALRKAEKHNALGAAD